MDTPIDLPSMTVLVADDSRLVCNTVVVILREMGFDSEKIFIAYKPKDVMHYCRSTSFDIIICDYNFNSYINGYQLLEELRHYNLLKKEAMFMFLTGESDPSAVRSMVTSAPDDYVLKPFNKPFLASRLLSGLRKKRSLLPIYENVVGQNYSEAVNQCSELLPSFPQYETSIRKIKAESHIELEQFSQAKLEYQALLNNNQLDWVKTSLASTMIKLDEIDNAKDVLATLKNQQDNPFYHDEMAVISALNDDIPLAIQHLKLSTQLLETGAERELVIANLSLAIEEFEDAYSYMSRYVEINENTYRSSEYHIVNFVRSFLYRFTSTKHLGAFENQMILVKPKITELNRNEDLLPQVNLIKAHIELIRGELFKALHYISQIRLAKDMHFYDYYHYIYLIDQCSIIKDMNQLMTQCRVSISQEQDISIKKSQQLMFDRLESKLKEKHQKITQVKADIARLQAEGITDTELYFDKYSQLKQLLPNGHKVSLAIVKFLVRVEHPVKVTANLHSLLRDCNDVIKRAMSKTELDNMKYDKMYEAARQKLTN